VAASGYPFFFLKLMNAKAPGYCVPATYFRSEYLQPVTNAEQGLFVYYNGKWFQRYQVLLLLLAISGKHRCVGFCVRIAFDALFRFF
jgi:hypothetical protein